jgi:pilus assembly protein CpaF
MLNLLLTVVVLLAGAGGVVLLYIRRRNERPDIVIQESLTMDTLLNLVKAALAEIVQDDYYFGRDDMEWEEAYKRKKRIQDAMKHCVHGIDADKIIVRDLIRDVVRKYMPTDDAVASLIDFDSVFIDPMIKWEILMYFLKKKYGKDALKYIIEKYEWDKVTYTIEEGTTPSHAVTVNDFDMVYAQEINRPLTYLEKLDVIAIILFTMYKGYGCIDTLREMNIDGVNCGTSGSILSSMLDVDSNKPRAPRSVWIYYEGKYIHLRFLTFYTEVELRRIILLICMYGNPGPLTEKRGYMVNTMYDKSRVLALRPGASEYWGIFIRKFNIQNVSLRSLYVKGDDKLNANLPVTLIEYLMRGRVTTAFTGRQGTGKTTAMIGAVAPIDGRLTIRVLEMTPEMYLRERYPERNIFSVSETQYTSLEELQDALKKSDAAISIVGEVATNVVAARMIQLGQVASLFTIFSHHANTTKDLIHSIRNSLVETGGFNNMLTAEQQVVDVVRVDVHIDFDIDGFRYFDRITEVVKVEEAEPYPEYDNKKPVDSMNKITREYYYRRTDRSSFKTRDIVVYDKKEKRYVAKAWFTPETTGYILKFIPENMIESFKEFVLSNWACGPE